jgi:hypothetical protein
MAHSIASTKKQLCYTCEQEVLDVNGGAELTVSNHPSFPGETGTLVDIIRNIYSENGGAYLDSIFPKKLFNAEGVICNVCLKKVATCYLQTKKVASAKALLTLLRSQDGS